MSVFTHEKELIQLAWTNQSGRAIQEPAIKDMKPFQTCPDTVLGISTFARVWTDENAKEYSRRKRLIHLHDVPPYEGQKLPVTFRIQGFVGDRNLGPMGNWDLKPNNVAGAVQLLNLTGGNQQRAWKLQTQALDAVVQFILRQAGSVATAGSKRKRYQPVASLTNAKTLSLRKQIFVKTEFGTGNAKMCAEDDPDGFTSSVSDEWNLGEKLDIDRECADGMLSPMNFMEIENGDFVDVMITPDIIARSDGTSVGFSMIKMVVLFKSTEVDPPSKVPDVMVDSLKRSAFKQQKVNDNMDTGEGRR